MLGKWAGCKIGQGNQEYQGKDDYREADENHDLRVLPTLRLGILLLFHSVNPIVMEKVL